MMCEESVKANEEDDYCMKIYIVLSGYSETVTESGTIMTDCFEGATMSEDAAKQMIQDIVKKQCAACPHLEKIDTPKGDPFIPETAVVLDDTLHESYWYYYKEYEIKREGD